ncbi:MAG: uracil phosphoribosyltransferase [Verrucomicrobia bacterium]|nr:uracil phosphoribosyltransferase [Verrucomicrobiota bacterium]MDA1087251.1 uracil phosphoribosyltransferase [Verrucomicrobiota bacterium]
MMNQNITVIEHALLEHSLSILRNRDTNDSVFRRHANTVAKILLTESTRNLATTHTPVETPISPTVCRRLDTQIVLMPVLRAGLAILPVAQELLPHAATGFMGVRRDEKTAEAEEYYQNIPEIPESHHVLILDPMLATGGSLESTISAVKEVGATTISVICVVAAPEGIERITKSHPEVRIITGAIDQRLNDDKFIVPGLGDFGDRYFGA